MMKRLLAGCWFSHDHVRSRTHKGALVYRCTDCGDERLVLAEEIVIGPAHRPAEVPGKPLTKTFTESVEKFKRRSA